MEEEEERRRQAAEAKRQQQEEAEAAEAAAKEEAAARLEAASRPSGDIMPSPLKIHLQNGHYKTLSYTTKTTARQIIAQVTHRMDIKMPELYGLCLRAPGEPIVSSPFFFL